jgi:hypothetical protein
MTHTLRSRKAAANLQKKVGVRNECVLGNHLLFQELQVEVKKIKFNTDPSERKTKI